MYLFVSGCLVVSQPHTQMEIICLFFLIQTKFLQLLHFSTLDATVHVCHLTNPHLWYKLEKALKDSGPVP